MTFTADHPRVRASTLCPLCCKPKANGLLLCWPCHRHQKQQNGGSYSIQVEDLIARYDATLATLWPVQS
jgi:hypothetical protein